MQDKELGIGAEELQEKLGLDEPIQPEIEEEPTIEGEELEENLDDDPINALPEEDREFAKGWNPEGEKSLAEFVRDGKFIKQIEDLKADNKRKDADFEKRIVGLTKLHEMQQENMRKELEQKLAEAVSMSDLDAVKETQAQINAIDNAKTETTIDVDSNKQAMSAWNESNPWVFEDSPKASYAKDVFGRTMQQNGGNAAEALAKVDELVAKHYGEQKPEPAPRTQKTIPSRTTAGKAQAPAKLQWSDLTPYEKSIYDQMGGDNTWSKKDYLQTVQDSRTGAQ